MRWPIMGLFRKGKTALAPVKDVSQETCLDNGRFLIEAVRAGEKNFVQYLLDRQVDVNVTDDRGNTPLGIAAHNGDMKLVQMLLGAQAQVGIPDHEGNTPLHWAAHRGHKNVVELLVASGAKINQVNNDGNSPLILAMLLGQKEVVQYLVDMDADITQANRKGVSALSIAESTEGRDAPNGIAAVVLRANRSVRPTTTVLPNATFQLQ